MTWQVEALDQDQESEALATGRLLELPAEELLVSPPLEFWPKVIRRFAVPDDLEEILLTKLKRFAASLRRSRRSSHSTESPVGTKRPCDVRK
jgi:hypothetical protein